LHLTGQQKRNEHTRPPAGPKTVKVLEQNVLSTWEELIAFSEFWVTCFQAGEATICHWGYFLGFVALTYTLGAKQELREQINRMQEEVLYSCVWESSDWDLLDAASGSCVRGHKYCVDI
jgi:hypothetical protein